ncbi:hypothetical protein [Micromonospora sp. NPDC023814]|uniref:hypothetical protein n=1 Tax=Micromonospora sp. NPDC023814 TaxID=3154596 RepID=UPI0033F311AC
MGESDREPVPWTQVHLTTRRSALGERIVTTSALGGTVIGIGIFIANSDAWWQTLLLVVTGLILSVIGLSAWFSAGLAAEATEKLQASGVRARAEILSAEEEHGGDDIVYRLELRIVPSGAEAFEVAHRCTKHVCRQAAKQTPPVYLTALVGPDDRTWGVVHP